MHMKFDEVLYKALIFDRLSKKYLIDFIKLVSTFKVPLICFTRQTRFCNPLTKFSRSLTLCRHQKDTHQQISIGTALEYVSLYTADDKIFPCHLKLF